MPGRSRTAKVTAGIVTLLGMAASPGIAVGSEPGFDLIFDGTSLSNWTGNPAYWSVEEGAITGRITKERPCTTNQYLVWNGGDLADFELKMEARLNGEGGINGGFQFRSRLLPDHDLCGYQVDTNLETDWLVRLYDEYGRHDLALRGERALFNARGERRVQQIESARGPAKFRLEDWNEYHLSCVGPRITLRVNGDLVAAVEDNDPRRAEPQGVLALQLHSGPPTVAQFRNIRLKVLKPAAPDAASGSWKDGQGTRPELFRDALAWWLLDAGGHGARPPLRLVPPFYQFELNVRPAGSGASVRSKVALLAGAYFDAGPALQVSGDQLTVYLRLRDPAGKWDSGLLSKGGEAEATYFNLFSSDPANGAEDPDISFAVRTEKGFALAGFPVSRIEATAWHNLVGRYNGKRLEIFCDGRLMASKALEGALAQNSKPLLIGAEMDGDRVVRHFHGEVEEAAIWLRALTDAEVAKIPTAAQ